MGHSIGSVLLQMKVLRPRELAAILKIQEKLSPEELLGELLVSRGFVTREQLETALESQRALRSGKPHVRALAVARVAEISGGRVQRLMRRTRAECEAARRRVTGEDHPAVTSQMLAVGEEDGR